MSEVFASPSVEQQFNRVVHAIEQRLHLLDRLPRVRINAWIKKLRDEVSGNVTWQRNRNSYARLLLEQLRAGCLEVPFNTMPPEGALPTLPSYLMYRFFSPPKQLREAYSSMDCYEADCSTSSACLAGCGSAGLARPHSAGAAAGAGSSLKHLPPAGAHDSWRVVWGSAFPPAGSPPRCGSPLSSRNVALQQQQHWHGGSPKSVRSAGSAQRGYSSCRGSPQRPRSPGAAGLLDAAAAVAAELEAEREEASRISSRLRFAEDKILQQEAELVRLQGAASSARRRIKSATSATLQEMLERYGSAAAAWTAAAGGSPTGKSAPAALADGVYRPVWQLLAGLQSVLDSCDQEEHEWVRAKGEAAAAALEAAYEAQEAAAGGGGMYPWDGAAAAGSVQKGSPKKAEAQQGKQQQQGMGQQAVKGVGQFASEAAAASAAEAAVLKHCEQCLLDLQQEVEQLVAELAAKKDEATAAAGGRGAAADVAEAAAKLLRPMLKALRHEAKDANKLRKRLEAAAEATDAAAAAASSIAATAAKSALKLQRSLLRKGADDSGSSSDSSSSSSSADSESEVSTVAESRNRSSSKGKRRQLKREQEVLAAAEQMQQQQGARLQRLQSASQVLAELDKASAKLERQLLEAQQRLQDMAAAGAASPASNHHDNGLVAAGTAGLTASLSAGLRAFHSTSSSLAALIQSLRSAAAAAAADAARVSERGLSSGGGSQPQQQRSSGSLLHSPPTPRGEQTVHFSAGDSSGGGSGSKLLGHSVSSRLGDSALAGTWGVQEAAAGAGAAAPLLSLRNGSEQVSSGAGSTYDAAAHYLIGAAAAASAGRSSAGSGSSRLTAGGLGLSVNPEAAAAASEGWRVLRSAPNSPRSLSLSGKTALAEQLHGASSGGGQLGSSSNISGGSSPRSDAAAEAVHAVHAQLAGLSRQASRLSLKANAILAAGGTEAAVGTGGLRALSGGSSLAGSFRQKEGLSAGASPFSAAPLSPRGAGLSGVSQRGGQGLGGLGVASALGSSGGSPPAAGSLLSSATRSALLGHAGARGVGLGTVGLGSIAARPALNSSFSSGYSGSLLKGGALGGLSGTSGSALGMGNSALLRAAGGGVGKLGVSSVPGVAAGTSSSLAAISSRLHSLTHSGR